MCLAAGLRDCASSGREPEKISTMRPAVLISHGLGRCLTTFIANIPLSLWRFAALGSRSVPDLNEWKVLLDPAAPRRGLALSPRRPNCHASKTDTPFPQGDVLPQERREVRQKGDSHFPDRLVACSVGVRINGICRKSSHRLVVCDRTSGLVRQCKKD